MSLARRSRSWLVRSALLGGVLLSVLLLTLPTAGIETREGDVLTVGVDEVIDDDLYVFGGEITIEGTIRGDLVGAARHVRILGTVEGDVIVAGQAVEIDGTVGDDARIAGQVLRFGSGARVGDHVMSAGYSLEAVSDSVIGGALVFSGFQTELSGTVEGGARLAANAVSLQGRIAGDVEAEVGGSGGPPPMMFLPSPPVSAPGVTGGLSLGSGAEIGGRLEYESPEPARIADGAVVVGEVVRTERPVELREAPPRAEPEAEAEEETPFAWLWHFLRRLVVLFVVGLTMALLARRWMGARVEQAISGPLPAFGWGVVGALGLLFGAFVATVLGIALAVVLGYLGAGGLAWLTVLLGLVLSGVFLFLFFGGWFYVAPVLVATAIGRWSIRRVNAESSTLVGALLVGLLLLLGLRSIPWIGGLIAVLLGLIGFGVAFRWLLDRIQHSAPVEAAPSEPAV